MPLADSTILLPIWGETRTEYLCLKCQGHAIQKCVFVFPLCDAEIISKSRGNKLVFSDKFKIMMASCNSYYQLCVNFISNIVLIYK